MLKKKLVSLTALVLTACGPMPKLNGGLFDRQIRRLLNEDAMRSVTLEEHVMGHPRIVHLEVRDDGGAVTVENGDLQCTKQVSREQIKELHTGLMTARVTRNFASASSDWNGRLTMVFKQRPFALKIEIYLAGSSMPRSGQSVLSAQEFYNRLRAIGTCGGDSSSWPVGRLSRARSPKAA